jgi:hypothetical protein
VVRYASDVIVDFQFEDEGRHFLDDLREQLITSLASHLTFLVQVMRSVFDGALVPRHDHLKSRKSQCARGMSG